MSQTSPVTETAAGLIVDRLAQLLRGDSEFKLKASTARWLEQQISEAIRSAGHAQTPALPDRERMADILYTAAHKGLRNCWKWADAELDHEHPTSRGYWYKIADGALAALSDTSTAAPAQTPTVTEPVHEFVPSKEGYGQFCEICGYGRSERLKHSVADTSTAAPAQCKQQPIAWRWRIKNANGDASGWALQFHKPNISKDVLHDEEPLYALSDTSTIGNTVAEPSRCKNTVARGESKEAGATTGDAPVASASTPSWQMADARLRSIVASANGNAKAAKIKDEDLTWQAHAREVERVSKMLRGLIGKEPADAVGSPKP